MPLRRAGTQPRWAPDQQRIAPQGKAVEDARERADGAAQHPGHESSPSKDYDVINPLETILRHQWALPLPFGDAHACP
jgi:hypothetical protein